MTFIDDYSKKTWVYLLKQKFQAFDVFKSFKAMAEKKSNRFIKVLRSDREGEYMSNEFMDFCKYYGIKRKFTAPYTSQQNGVAERKNRTLMNMARSMMKEKHL